MQRFESEGRAVSLGVFHSESVRLFGVGPDLHSRIYPRRYREVEDARYRRGTGRSSLSWLIDAPAARRSRRRAAGSWGSVASLPTPRPRREPYQTSGNKRPNSPAQSDGG